MVIKPVNYFPIEFVDALLANVSFFRTVKHTDQTQYEQLLFNSTIAEYDPGEVVFSRGQVADDLCFLLRGKLEIRSGILNNNKSPISHITPGEVFGDLAMLLGGLRTATVAVSDSVRKSIIVRTNSALFSEINKFYPLSLETKLTYYRNMVHNLRWKLEVYRDAYPEQEFTSLHRRVKLFTGKRNTFDELICLDKQSRELAQLLVRCNTEIERLGLLPFQRQHDTCMTLVS